MANTAKKKQPIKSFEGLFAHLNARASKASSVSGPPIKTLEGLFAHLNRGATEVATVVDKADGADFAVPEQAAITVRPAKTKTYDRPYMPMSEYIAMHKAAGTYQPKPRDPNAPAKTEAATDAADGAAKARKPVSEAQRRFYAGYHARKRAAAAQSAA